MSNVVNSIIWFIVLLFLSFFVAGFCAGWYILFHPLSVCIEPLSGACEILMKGIQFPHYCASNMMSGAPLG